MPTRLFSKSHFGFPSFSRLGVEFTSRAALDPRSILGDKLFGMWDASDPTTLFTTSGGSTKAVSTSDPIGRWEDKSGYANHWLQPTGLLRPTLDTAGINSRPAVVLGGSAWMNCPDSASQHAPIIWCMMSMDTSVLGKTIGIGYPFGTTHTAPFWNWLFSFCSAATTNSTPRVGNTTAGVTVADQVTPSILSWDSSTGDLRQNNVSKGTGPTGVIDYSNQTTTGMLMGANAGGAEIMTGHFGQILLASAVPNATQQALCFAWMRARCGI